LRQRGHDVRLVDLTASGETADTLADTLGRAGWIPTLILFPSTFPTWDADARALAVLKTRTGAPLVSFGPHASAAPAASMARAPVVDGLLVGEPEDGAVALAALGPGDDWRAVESLTFRDGDTIVPHRASGRFAGFPQAPGPDWTGVDFARYRLPLVNAPYALVETSRGCPYTCEFCVAPIHQGHTFRARATDRIVAEIERGARERALTYFYLWGDTVTLNLKTFGALADALIAKPMGIRWLANARADNLADPRFVNKLKASGCWMLSFGVEAWSPDSRDAMQKKLGQVAIRAAVANLKAAGIYSFAFFILGYPGETRLAMEHTINFASELDVDFAGFYPAVPYPGTVMGDRAAASGWLTHPGDWSQLEYSHYAMRNGELDEATVMAMIARARRKFYLRPGYVAHHVMDLARVALTKPGVTARAAAEMLGRRRH
jgi:anaerobic magnesium-protoporphyrin IX monomethyl ester cyclase